MAARDRDLRYGELLLGALFPLSLLPYATVHPGWRAGIALLAGLLGAAAVLRGLATRQIGRKAVMVFAPALGAMLLSALVAIPAGPGLRDALMPGLSEGLNASIAQSGTQVLPLALDPRRGLLEWAVNLQWLLLAGGLAFLVRDSRKAARLARLLVGSGVGLVVIAGLHRLTGAEHVWWVSQVPGYSKDPFFAPFVNPNHGGIACAALAPLALALCARDRGPGRTLGIAGLVVLVGGVLLSGSRGALLALAGAGLPTLLLLVKRPVRIGVGMVAGALLLMVLGYGIEPSLRALSEFLVPDALVADQDLYTGRGDIYGDALAVVRAAPLLGVGHGGFDDAYRVLKSTTAFTDPVHAHQELIQIAAEHGLLAFALWVVAFGSLMVLGLQAAFDLESPRRRWMLAGWLGSLSALAVASQFTFPLRIGALEVLAATCSGAVLGLAQLSSRDKVPDPTRRLYGLGTVAALGWLAMGLWAATGGSSTSLLGDADAAEELGDQALISGDLASAQAAYELSIRRQPVNARSLQKLARVQDKRGDWAAVFDNLEAATQVQPANPWVWRDMARLKRALTLYDDSRDAYARMLALELPDADRPAAVREAMRGPGKPSEIAAAIAPPERPEVLVLIARQLEDKGDREAAQLYYTRAFEGDPRHGSALAAALLRWKRNPERALELLGRTPESCHSLEIQGRAHFKKGNYDQATRVWTRTLGECASDDEALRHRLRIGLARCQLEQGDPEGLRVLERMVKDDPKDVDVWRVLARDAREERDPTRLERYLEGIQSGGELTELESEQLTLLHLNQPMFVVLGEGVPGENEDNGPPTKPHKGQPKPDKAKATP
ncbi:MAG: O-antigen ligase family protein [Myxococcota bacterium]|nr:O-antigen ligase family protein [Myxococcota bacterium]